MKKVFFCILAILIMIPLFVACAADNGGDSVVTTKPVDNESEETTVVESQVDLPQRDLEGREFMFYVMGIDRNVNNYSVEIFAELENGDPINDAVYKRNLTLEERYNFKILETASTDSSMPDIAARNIQAGDDTYQVLMFNLRDATNLVQKNMLVNLYEADYLNFDKPWWDTSMAKDLSIVNKLFYAMGDINIMDNNATWAVFFNKKMINDFNMTAPYVHVNDNNWTLSKYYEMAQLVSTDLDGDGVIGTDDIWGTVGEGYNAYMLYTAAGERITEKDSDDIPQLLSPSDRTFAVIDEVYKIMNDRTLTLNAEHYSGYANVFSDLIRRNFKTDLSLFYIAGMLSYTLLRDMESEYGMVPMPKLNSEQDKYYTTLNMNNCSTVCIPISNNFVDDTAFILEAMAAESMTTLTPAYYEIALERKYMRDEESRQMLDIILDSRVYDLASLYNWGGVYAIFPAMVSADSVDYASRFESVKEKAIIEIEETIESLK